MATSKKPRAVEHRQGHNDNEQSSSGTFVSNKRVIPNSGANARAGEISKPNVERWHKAVEKYNYPKDKGIMGVLGMKHRTRGQNESKKSYFLSGYEGNKEVIAKQKARYDKKPGLNGK